jgi:hypothetical protein
MPKTEPMFNLSTRLNSTTEACRRRLEVRTGWTIRRLIAEALASLEASLQAKEPAKELVHHRGEVAA